METYERSGRVSGRLALFAPVGLVVFAGLGVGLQFVQGLSPWIALDGMLLLFFAMLGAGCAGYLMRWSHCRSLLVGVTVGLIFGAVAAAADFGFEYVLARLGETTVGFVEWIEIRVDKGYGVSGRGPGVVWLDGPYVYAIWGVEALLLVGGAMLGGWSRTSRPYCEECGSWCSESTSYVYSRPDPAVVEQVQTATRPGEVVGSSEGAGRGAATTDLLYEVKTCPECRAVAYLDVTYREFPADPRKLEVESERESHLWIDLKVGASELERLAEVGARLE